MDWLKKLPNSMRSASGLEWRLWRRLPLIAAVGTALLLAVAAALHVLSEPGNAGAARWLQTMDYVLIGVLAVHWAAVFTTAMGCVVVMLMKGPGYVADALEVSHSEQPRRSSDAPQP